VKIAMFYGGMTNAIPRVYSLAKQYKSFGAITIAGGSHVDALPEEALGSGIDIVVHGEGEETTKELLEVIVKYQNVIIDPEDLLKVKGISFLDKDNNYVFTGKRDSIEDLDLLVDVDLTLIKYLEKKWSAIPINRGRGCNWNCEFCVVNKQYGKFKACSVEKAMKQIIKYSDLGYKNFFFTDDNFAQNTDETIELCRLIGDYKRRFGKKINLTVQVRSEVAENDELLAAMKFAGVNILAIGYESPIDDDLKNMKKGVTVKKLVRRSRKLSDFFYLHGMFIFGYPTFKDSKFIPGLNLEQRAKEYERFFKKAKIDTVQVFNAVPLPGSQLRAKLEYENRVLPKEMVGWEKYDGLFLCYDPTPEGLDAYNLQDAPKDLMKKWYLGNFLNRKLNYGRWMDWTYNATLGFPIQFSTFYFQNFIKNTIDKIKEKRVIREKEGLFSRQNIFLSSLSGSWNGIKRSWRNLFVKTYAGGIVRGWIEEYKKSDYAEQIQKYFAKKVSSSKPSKSLVKDFKLM